MREYIIKSIGSDLVVNVKNDRDCIFCDHCTDILWDYTHGPYLLYCELDRPEVDSCVSENHTCDCFIETKDPTE